MNNELLELLNTECTPRPTFTEGILDSIQDYFRNPYLIVGTLISLFTIFILSLINYYFIKKLIKRYPRRRNLLKVIFIGITVLILVVVYFALRILFNPLSGIAEPNYC